MRRTRGLVARRGHGWLVPPAPVPPPGPGPVPPALYRRPRARYLPLVRPRFAGVVPRPVFSLCQDLNGAITGLVEYSGAVLVVAHAGAVSEGLSYTAEVSAVSYAGEVSVCGR